MTLIVRMFEIISFLQLGFKGTSRAGGLPAVPAATVCCIGGGARDSEAEGGGEGATEGGVDGGGS